MSEFHLGWRLLMVVDVSEKMIMLLFIFNVKVLWFKGCSIKLVLCSVYSKLHLFQ